MGGGVISTVGGGRAVSNGDVRRSSGGSDL